jgi:hypothetical protein
MENPGHFSAEINNMSGDSASGWAANGVPNSHMIQKPFATAQVVTAISQLINMAEWPL